MKASGFQRKARDLKRLRPMVAYKFVLTYSVKERGGSGFPSFPPLSLPLFHFLALVSFLARSKPKIPFLGLSLLRNQTDTLATKASVGCLGGTEGMT